MNPREMDAQSLNAWIAEHIFGYEWYMLDPGLYNTMWDMKRWLSAPEHSKTGTVKADMKIPADYEGMPDYLTDAAACLRLVEKVLKDGDREDRGVWFEPECHRGLFQVVLRYEHEPPDGDVGEVYLGGFDTLTECLARTCAEAWWRMQEAKSE